MRKIIVATVIAGFISVPALAQRPDTAGKGKANQSSMESRRAQVESGEVEPGPYHEEMQSRREEMERRADAKGDMDRDSQQDRDRMREHQPDMMNDKQKPGLQKQTEKKMAQEQKEMGKGSEQGQESRSKRRKWWKFWGSDEE